jgi:glycosyltransferase involved in cell wall biosynthesis
MKTVFICSGPHYSHDELAKTLNITNKIKTPTKGIYSIPFIGKILSAKSVQKEIEKINPDVILTESLTRDLLAGYFYKKKNRKTKLMAIAADPKLYYLKTSFDIDQILTNASLQSVDWFLCSGEQMRDFLPLNKQQKSTVFYPKIKYKPNNFFPSFINFNNFYFVGSLVHSKGIKEMNKYFVNSEDKLIVYGDGPEKYRLHKEIKYRGFNPNPHEAAIDEAAFIVSFADFEPFGLAPIEGMLFGMIPFVSNKCGCKEFVSLIHKDLVFENVGCLRDIHHKIRKDEKFFKMLSIRAKEIADYYLKISNNSYLKCEMDVRLHIFHRFLYK